MPQKDESPQNFDQIQKLFAAEKGQTRQRKEVATQIKDEYGGLMRNLMRGRSGEPRGHTEDGVSDVLVKVVQSAKVPRVFNTEGEFVVWLKKVVRSVKVDRGRRELRNVPLTQPLTADAGRQSSSDWPDRRRRVSTEQLELAETGGSADIQQLDEDEHDRKRLEELLRTLSPTERKLLLMGADDDVEWRQVGEAFDMTCDQARMKYNRLLDRLKKKSTRKSEGDSKDA